MGKFYLGITIVTAIFLGAILYGFSVVGTPSSVRSRRLDDSRVSDLSQISYYIENYYEKYNELPAELIDLKKVHYGSDDLLEGEDALLRDPETKEKYEYRILGKFSYQLCATFATSTEDARKKSYTYSYSYGAKDFKHPKGRYCFELEIPESRRISPTPDYPFYPPPGYTPLPLYTPAPTPTPIVHIEPEATPTSSLIF